MFGYVMGIEQMEIAFKNGIDYVNTHYGVTLQYEQMQCGFTDFNEQCIKERCPFYE